MGGGEISGQNLHGFVSLHESRFGLDDVASFGAWLVFGDIL